MSSVPAEIAGLGSSAMKLRVSPAFDPLKAQVGPDEYFVLSRIDGSQTLRDVLLSTGLPVDRGIAIITKLRSIGALLLPHETVAPAPAVAPAAPRQPPEAAPAPMRAPAVAPAAVPSTPHGVAVPRTSTPKSPMPIAKGPASASVPAIPSIPAIPSASPVVSRTTTPHTPMPGSRLPHRPVPAEIDPPTQPLGAGIDPPTQPRRPATEPRPPAPDPSLDQPTVRRAPSMDINVVLPRATDAERAALAEQGELGPDARLRILAMARLVEAGDPYALLGVPSGADAKVLKRAYFKLSKEIHPDRFYGKQLGSFKDRLSLVFEAVSRAYAKLTSPERSRPTGAHQAVTEQPQTPQEYAAELFDRACSLEVGGDALGAMKLFAAAVRIDGQTRYFKRAASCALAAEQPKTAVEYAKKAQAQAPNDPSCARLLAQAFRSDGRYSDAEEVLVMAMAIKNENDVLTAELRNDLAEVRRLLSG